MKKVLINVEERELRVAILEDEQLVELYIESLDEKSILNNIYKGRVEDVLPGLKAAFVNVGLDRNAFLHFDDVRPDLIWGKYRDMNPDLADEVPSAREALAGAVDSEVEDDTDQDDSKRKRRRGRRGGKKRRPDAEDTYSPGLPVGVTEDDLEDDEDEDIEVVNQVAPTARVEPTAAAAPQTEYARPEQQDARPEQKDQQDGSQSTSDAVSDEIEARKQARIEKQKQRRERWEQKKLERQQRRQQERADRLANQQPGNVAAAGQEVADASSAPVHRASAPAYRAPAPEVEILPPPAHGTRAAATAHDFSGGYAAPNRRQLQQFKARYGDNFGNIAIGGKRQQDNRDSQEDFFGPNSAVQEEEYSIWDERQPNLGPVPGAGKAFLPDMESRGNQRRSSERRPNTGQQQNRNNKKFTSSNKRRGGKKRSMRKRDNRSYFAFSADDIENDKPLSNEAVAEEAEAPKKRTTRKKAATAKDGEEAPKKKPAARKPAAKKTTATRKKKTDDAETPELPLGMEVSGDASAPAEETAAPKKTTRARKTAAPRTRKATAKKAGADELDLDARPESAEAKTAAEPAAEKPSEKKEDVPVPVAPAPVAQETAASQPSAEAPRPPAPRAEVQQPVAPAPVSEATATEASNASQTADTASTEQPSPAGDQGSVEAGYAGSAGETKAPTGEQQGGPQRRRNNRPSRAERAARHRAKRAEAKAASAAARADGTEAAEAGEDNKGAGSTTAQVEPAVSTAPEPEVATVDATQAPTTVVPTERPRQQQQPQRREQRHKLRRPQFQEVFKKGDEIMVQVVKEEIGMKGARISSYVSLPGRYLVLLPYPNQEGGISRKVEDIRERKRLKNLLRDISSDETAFIVRTAGVYQEEKEIRDDVEFLSHEWATIADRYAKAEATGLVYDDHDIIYRLARDVFDDSVAEIHIDSHTEHDKLKQILGKLIPGLVDKVKLYSGAENIFHKFGVTKQIQKAARRKVWLKSGGYLIIDEAEALTAIDVNTGKSVGKDDQEKLILRTNIEASRAVARELKLRDLGGLIVIDFIDMKDARNKEQVLSELKLQLRKDRSKTSVSAISEFGLVEMTRKRVRRSLRKTLFMDCPYCQGAGVVLNEQQIWLHIKHEVVRQLESTKPAPTLSITVNPRIRAYIDQNYREVIRRLEQKYDTEIRFTMSDIFHIENYQIEAAETSGVISGSATMPTR